MEEFLALIGLLFLVFLLLGLGCGLLGSEEERKRYAHGMVFAICGIMAYLLGSWLISGGFISALEWLYEILGFWLFMLPAMGCVLMGLFKKIRSRKNGKAHPSQ